MKILSYNIMSGGFNNYDYSTPNPQRVNLIKNVLEVNKADIVSLVDTFRWDEIYTTDQLSKMFNYKHVYCINLNDERLKKLGHNNGITVLSKIENTTFDEVSLGSRSCILSTIPTPSGLIKLFSLYLDDLNEDTRLKQLEKLKIQLTQDASIIAGDLNTCSPKDVEETLVKVEKFLEQNPKYNGLRNQLIDMARSEVINSLFELGFKDASDHSRPTFPSSLTSISAKPLLRLDFFLYKNVKIKRCETLYGELYDKASDHYPLLLEL